MVFCSWCGLHQLQNLERGTAHIDAHAHAWEMLMCAVLGGAERCHRRCCCCRGRSLWRSRLRRRARTRPMIPSRRRSRPCLIRCLPPAYLTIEMCAGAKRSLPISTIGRH